MGEALIDRIKNKSNQKFTDFLGGAPSNVAFALSKLNVESVFMGSLGNDEFGEKFIRRFDDLQVNVDFLQLNNFPTRIVKVNRDDSGDRYFAGFAAKAKTVFADAAFSKKLIQKDLKSLEKLFSKTKYFVCGTIMLSSPHSAEALFFLIELAKKFDVQVVVDLNWREVFWDYSYFSLKMNKDEIIKLIKDLLDCSNIVKFAKEEAILFFKEENPISISQKILSQPEVIITDGANPVSWFFSGIQGSTEVFNSSSIIDTTGAGDAFLAGLISQLISLNFPKDEIEIQNCIKFAGACGLLTCLGEGAIEPHPSYEKVNEFLGSQI